MVGLQVLVLAIEVRILAPEHITKVSHVSEMLLLYLGKGFEQVVNEPDSSQ